MITALIFNNHVFPFTKCNDLIGNVHFSHFVVIAGLIQQFTGFDDQIFRLYVRMTVLQACCLNGIQRAARMRSGSFPDIPVLAPSSSALIKPIPRRL